MVHLFWLAPLVLSAVLIAYTFCVYRCGYKDGEEYGRLRSEMEIPLNLRRHNNE